jgi:hypothetical protein
MKDAAVSSLVSIDFSSNFYYYLVVYETLARALRDLEI